MILSPPATPTLAPAEIVERVKTLAGDAYLSGRVYRGDPVIEIRPASVSRLARILQDDQALRFELLVDVTAVHWPLDREREFEVVYQFRSVRNNLYVRLKTRIAQGAHLNSIAAVYRAASWLEREVYDLMGIQFDGHPDLRRILLPDGYEGHPLRKDYPVDGPNFPADAHRNDWFGRLDPDDFWDERDD